jgi:hypothetical protein
VTGRRTRTGLAALALLAGGTSCSGGDDDTAAPEAGAGATTPADDDGGAADVPVGSYVGTTDGAEAYVAVVLADDGRVLAFVTDGDQSVDLMEGLVDLDGGGAWMENDGGASVEVTLDRDTVTGTFTRPESPALGFTAEEVDEPAGLYRASQILDDGLYEANWVVLEDGSQKGAVRRYETPLPPGAVDPVLDLSEPDGLSVTVPGGVLHPIYVDAGRL